jgi:hypothetical protein
MANRFIIEVRTKGFTEAGKDLNNLNTQSRAFVKNSNRARTATAALRSSMSALRNNLLLLTFTFGALVVAVNKTVAAYRKQVEAETRLRASMRNVATASKDGADKLINLASALQKVTTFGDEQIIAGQAMLATFQLNEDAIGALTERMLDMAVAQGTGGDGLTSVALQLGKAFTGQVGALSRSGVLIDQAALKSARAAGATQEFAFLVGELDKNFKGLSKELGTTTLGQIDQLNNQVSDLNEQMGQLATPTALATAKLKLFGTIGLNKTLLTMQNFFKNLDMGGDLLAQWTIALGVTDAQLTTLANTVKNTDLGPDPAVVAGLEREIALIKEETETLKLLGEETKKGNYVWVETNRNAEEFLKQRALENQLLTQQRNINLEIRQQEAIIAATKAKGLETTVKQQNDLTRLKIKDHQVTQAIQQAELKASAGLLSSLSQLAGTNKKFALAGARLAQGSAIIDAYAGFNKALAQGGILGFITGASVLASGLANVLTIQNQINEMQGAKYGADFITSGPQMMMVGEGSGPEHVQVTPLADSNINGPQGGGAVTINISGGVVQEDYVRNELIPAINRATGTGAKLNNA